MENSPKLNLILLKGALKHLFSAYRWVCTPWHMEAARPADLFCHHPSFTHIKKYLFIIGCFHPLNNGTNFCVSMNDQFFIGNFLMFELTTIERFYYAFSNKYKYVLQPNEINTASSYLWRFMLLSFLCFVAMYCTFKYSKKKLSYDLRTHINVLTMLLPN